MSRQNEWYDPNADGARTNESSFNAHCRAIDPQWTNNHLSLRTQIVGRLYKLSSGQICVPWFYVISYMHLRIELRETNQFESWAMDGWHRWTGIILFEPSLHQCIIIQEVRNCIQFFTSLCLSMTVKNAEPQYYTACIAHTKCERLHNNEVIREFGTKFAHKTKIPTNIPIVFRFQLKVPYTMKNENNNVIIISC